MATFRTCVQKQRKDGFYPVYIHVTHLKKSMWFVNMNYDSLRCGGGAFHHQIYCGTLWGEVYHVACQY